ASSDVGMVIFLASWLMMFAGLFFAYAELRVNSSMWPPLGITQRLPVALPGLNTAILALSSIVLATGLGRLRSGRPATFPRFLVATLALGVLFLALQVKVWLAVSARRLHVDTGAYGGVFYLRT